MDSDSDGDFPDPFGPFRTPSKGNYAMQKASLPSHQLDEYHFLLFVWEKVKGREDRLADNLITLYKKEQVKSSDKPQTDSVTSTTVEMATAVEIPSKKEEGLSSDKPETVQEPGWTVHTNKKKPRKQRK